MEDLDKNIRIVFKLFSFLLKYQQLKGFIKIKKNCV